MYVMELIMMRTIISVESVADDGVDGGDPPHGDDDVQAGAGDCLGAIQLVERECRGLVNSRDHLGRYVKKSINITLKTLYDYDNNALQWST